MDKLDFYTFVKIIKLDLALGIIVGVCIEIVFGEFGFILVIGIAAALINLAVNYTITKMFFKKMTGISALLFTISYLLRIFLVSVIGYIVFTNNKFGALIFILGYTAHFASLVIVSLQGVHHKERS